MKFVEAFNALWELATEAEKKDFNEESMIDAGYVKLPSVEEIKKFMCPNCWVWDDEKEECRSKECVGTQVPLQVQELHDWLKEKRDD